MKPGVGIVRLYDRAFGSNSFDLWFGNTELFEEANRALMMGGEMMGGSEN